MRELICIWFGEYTVWNFNNKIVLFWEFRVKQVAILSSWSVDTAAKVMIAASAFMIIKSIAFLALILMPSSVSLSPNFRL